MIASIEDNHWITIHQLSPDIEEQLISWFSVRDPQSYYLNTESGWDGWYRRYQVSKQRLALPYLNELIARCGKANIPLEIEDRRGAPRFPAPQEDQITEKFLDGITLEGYQVRGIRACCAEEIGLVSSPTGSGKTEMICGLVKAFRCPTVIVTEQIVVLEQIVERLALRNVVHNDDIGMFCCGFMPSNNLVLVGSIQSVSSPKRPNRTALAEKFDVANALSILEGWCSKGNPVVRKLFPTALADALYDNPSGVHRLHGKYLQVVTDHFLSETWKRLWKAFSTRLSNAQKIQELVKRCDLAIIDEADLATNQLYTTFFKKYFSGRRRYGFTGTPYDKNKPVQALFLRENLGNVIFEVPRAEVEAAKRIIPIKFYMIGIGEGGNREDKRAFDIAMKQEIIENKAFHQRVAEIVSAFQNDRSLILVDTSPIAPLGVGLEECIAGSKFIYGGTPRNIRNRYVEDFENGRLSCLIGSKIFRRGLDLRGGVDNLIIIGGGKSWSDFDQKLGRAVRVNKRGWSRVFGFFYFNNRYLYRHSRENLKAVVDLGYETKVIVGGTEIEGDKFIRSKFRIPKGKG